MPALRLSFPLVSLLFATLVAQADNAEWKALMSEGNESFSRANYEAAAKRYEAALQQAEQFPEPDWRLGGTQSNLGAAYTAQARYAEAEAALGSAISRLESVFGESGIALLPALENLAELESQLGHYEAAAIALERRSKLADEAPDGATAIEARLALAAHRVRQGRYVDARDLMGGLADALATLELENEDAASLLVRAADVHVSTGAFEAAETLIERALTRLQSRSGPASARGSALYVLGRMQLSLGELGAADESFDQALSAAHDAFGRSDPRLAVFYEAIAETRAARGRLSDAESNLERALGVVQARLGSQHPTWARIATRLASVRVRAGEFEEAARSLAEIEAAAEAGADPAGERGADYLFQKAGLEAALGNFERARSAAEEAVMAAAASGGVRHPRVAGGRILLAKIYAALGEREAARDESESALEVMREALGPGHPLTIATEIDVAEVEAVAGRTDEASARLRALLQRSANSLPATHPSRIRAQIELGRLQSAAADFDAALGTLEAARDQLAAAALPEHPLAGDLHMALGGLHLATFDLEGANSAYSRAIEIMEKDRSGRKHPRVAGARLALGRVYELRARSRDAEKEFEKARQTIVGSFGEKSPELVPVLVALSRAQQQWGKAEEARKALDEAAALAGEAPAREAPVKRQRARLEHDAGNYLEAAEQLERALAVLEREIGPYDLGLHDLLVELGVELLVVGRLDASEERLEAAMSLARDHFEAPHPGLVPSRLALAELYLAQGRLAELEDLLEETFQIIEHAYPSAHPDLARVLSARGELHVAAGRYDAAEADFRKALEVDKALFGDAHPRRLTAQRAVADLRVLTGRAGDSETPLDDLQSARRLAREGQLEQAQAQLERSLREARKTWGEGHPRASLVALELAALHIERGAYDEAAALTRKTREVFAKALGDSHPLVAVTIRVDGERLSAMRRFPEARTMLSEAIDRLETAGAYLELVAAHEAMAGLDALTYDYEEALLELERAENVLQASVEDTEHPGMIPIHSARAAIWRSLGDYETARTELERALDIQRAVLAADLPAIARLERELARVFESAGDTESARARFSEAISLLEEFSETPLKAMLDEDLARMSALSADLDDAVSLQREVVNTLGRTLGDSHPRTAVSRHVLGSYLAARGDHARAGEQLTSALAVLEGVYGPQDELVAEVLSDLAMLRREEGNHEEAQTLQERSLAIVENIYGADHPEVARAKDALAAILVHRGMMDEAEALYEEALGVYQREEDADPETIVASLRNLAAINLATRRDAQARELLERARSISEQD